MARHRSGDGAEQSLEELVAVLRDELEHTRGIATEARDLGSRALKAAEQARAALGEGGAEEPDADGPTEPSGRRATPERTEPSGRPAAPEPDAAGRAAAPRSAPPSQGDPLADALSAFADELRTAADARARGELDAPEAFRLLRTGFHKTRRVLGALQREERRAR